MLPGEKDKEHKEFLADVTSLANTVGGDLIFGIKSEEGVPIELTGIQLDNIDGQKLRLESMIRDGVAPRIPPIEIHPVELDSKPGHFILILRIKESWLLPHRITYLAHGHGDFYARSSAGKYPLDVTELRTAFERSGTLTENIRDFRATRIIRIDSGKEIPVILKEQSPKLVLHIIPFNAFSSSSTVNLKSLNNPNQNLLQPLMIWDIPQHTSIRFNIDGIVESVGKFNSPSQDSYTQVFRNGIIETVDTSILEHNALSVSSLGASIEPKSFYGEIYERKLLETLNRFFNLQKFLDNEPPFFIMVSFLGVKGYKILDKQIDIFYPYTEGIDRFNLIIPEIMIGNFEMNLAEQMRPIFDTVWNSAGYIGSLNYDSNGQFKYGY